MKKNLSIKIFSMFLSLLIVVTIMPAGAITALSSTINQGLMYEESTIKPDNSDGKLDIQEVTQYRYRDKEFSTGNTKTKNGWTWDGTKSERVGNWSAWQDSVISGYTTESVKREVSTQKVTTYSSKPQYNYYRYAANYSGGYSSEGWQNDKQNAYFYTFDSELAYGGTTNRGTPWYKWYYNGSNYCALYKCGTGYNTGGTFITYKQVASGTKTQYRYRDINYIYNFYRWKSWSAWSDTKVTANNNRQVETRTIYRYAGHSYDKGKVTKASTCTESGVKTYTCTVGGETKTETIAKKAHTYKTTTTKATAKKNGSVVKKCSVCGATSTTTIYYPKTITLSTTSYTYNGKAKKPSVTVKDSKGKKIAASNYTVSYQSGRKNVGKYTVTIKFKGNYSGTVKKTFTIKPKATSFKSVTSPEKKTIGLKWGKISSISGYQVQYSTSSKFAKNLTKTQTAKASSASARISRNISSKKTYYIRIRTYKTVNGTKYYSSWSKVKSVKTK